jgi:hypothetical protein
MTLFSKLAAAAALCASVAGAVQAMPVQPAPFGEGDAAIAEAVGRMCYPRIRYTYRPGHGVIPIVVGQICIPFLALPIPRPGPGPDPAPIDRFAPSLR